MNLTPLIDVLLVLIIVFMVVVIEQRPTGLQAEIPPVAFHDGLHISLLRRQAEQWIYGMRFSRAPGS